ncbi:MAG: recombination mediator RecR [Patescibacteria group bacterium]
MDYNSSLPRPVEDAIASLSLLPGVGRRSAERYVQYLLKSDSTKAESISQSLGSLVGSVKRCPVTFAFIDNNTDISELYSDPKRDKTVIAVVADPFDIYAIEKTGYRGTYHVLGGLLSPIDGITPTELNIPTLIQRCKKDHVKELILATNASVEGEATSHYIAKQLEDMDIHITRLARGLPIGLDIEYADMITLTRAIEGRQTL